jgi:hypothetical protein
MSDEWTDEYRVTIKVADDTGWEWVVHRKALIGRKREECWTLQKIGTAPFRSVAESNARYWVRHERERLACVPEVFTL